MTPPSLETFVARYPEFGEVPTEYAGLIQQFLDEAGRWTGTKVYGSYEQAADACMLKAAILACASPYARKMRLSDVGGARYELELARKQRAATMGMRVF